MSFLVVSKRTEKENKKERKRMSYQEHEANIDRGERELRRRKERIRKEGRKEGRTPRQSLSATTFRASCPARAPAKKARSTL